MQNFLQLSQMRVIVVLEGGWRWRCGDQSLVAAPSTGLDQTMHFGGKQAAAAHTSRVSQKIDNLAALLHDFGDKFLANLIANF